MADALTAGWDAAAAFLSDPNTVAPPWYLFVIISLPHLFYIWVLTHAPSTIAVAKLFHSDPCDWFAMVALILNALQLSSCFHWAVTSGQQFLFPSLLRIALGAAGWAVGSVFKVAIFTAIGKRGVYYGTKFGHQIPWVDGFPFSVTGARRPPARCKPPLCVRFN